MRTGFFGPGEFAALLLAPPAEVANLVRFLYMTGWRRGEPAGLTWAQIDWNDDQFPGEHSEPSRVRRLAFESVQHRRKAGIRVRSASRRLCASCDHSVEGP